MQHPFQLILVSILIICCHTYAKPQSVFIGTSKSENVKLNSVDAAIALNSIHFMEQLIGVKNSANVKTYTQPTNAPNIHHVAAGNGNWTKFIPNMFKQRLSITDDGTTVTDEDKHISYSQSTSDWRIPIPRPKHETVAEYTGELWFLNKSDIRFRETIKIIAISPDGNTSILECHTEYHNGSQWVSCAKIVCEFTSHTKDDGSNSLEMNTNGMGVKMSLDCELLVWLPLPKRIKKGVQNKISSVFENVALEFFNAKRQ